MPRRGGGRDRQLHATLAVDDIPTFPTFYWSGHENLSQGRGQSLHSEQAKPGDSLDVGLREKGLISPQGWQGF